MISLEFVGEEEAKDISEFAHPIWREVFAPMLVGGEEEEEFIFDSWQSPEGVLRDMRSGIRYGYVTDGGRKVGYFGLRPEEDGSLFLSKVYLVPEERGKGHGSELLQAMLAWGREHGCRRAYLHVNVRNEKAIRAYERNGFSAELHEITYQGDGFSTNDFVMSREV